MSQRTGTAKHAIQTPPKSAGREAGTIDSALAIRLVIAAVIFAVALIVKMPTFLRIVLLILSAAAAGYDIFLEAINSVEEGNYFATPLIVVFVAVIGFVIGFPTESAALILLYQICALALAYAEKRTQDSALALVNDQDEELVAKVREILEEKDAGDLRVEATMRESAGLVLRGAMILAVLYAILLPLFTAFPFRVSIHRALMIILVSTPGSIVAAMPLAGLIGLCFSAQKGIVFSRAAALEKAVHTNTVVFDKDGVFADNCPELLSIQSTVLDRETFMNFAAHAAYYSDQPFAKAISNAYDQEYKLEVVSDFRELPGNGVELKIGGTPVILATGEYLTSRGASVPLDPGADGQPFYLVIAGRYIGKLIVSANVNEETDQLVAGMQAEGVARSILLTEDSAEESRRIAEDLGFSEFDAANDTQSKLAYIHDLASAQRNQVMYVYANGIETHSDAALDVRVSKKAKYADAVAFPAQVSNLPETIGISRRMHEIAVENAVFAFVVKAILIFLCIIGYCTLWFAVFIDMAAAIATVLNTIRVTTNSRFFKSSDSDEEEDEEE